jgi:hypothetical protein
METVICFETRRSTNWSDIIAKVNANVESLSPSTARKLTNTVLFVTIDEKAAQPPRSSPARTSAISR